MPEVVSQQMGSAIAIPCGGGFCERQCDAPTSSFGLKARAGPLTRRIRRDVEAREASTLEDSSSTAVASPLIEDARSHHSLLARHRRNHLCDRASTHSRGGLALWDMEFARGHDRAASYGDLEGQAGARRVVPALVRRPGLSGQARKAWISSCDASSGHQYALSIDVEA